MRRHREKVVLDWCAGWLLAFSLTCAYLTGPCRRCSTGARARFLTAPRRRRSTGVRARYLTAPRHCPIAGRAAAAARSIQEARPSAGRGAAVAGQSSPAHPVDRCLPCARLDCPAPPPARRCVARYGCPAPLPPLDRRSGALLECSAPPLLDRRPGTPLECSVPLLLGRRSGTLIDFSTPPPPLDCLRLLDRYAPWPVDWLPRLRLLAFSLTRSELDGCGGGLSLPCFTPAESHVSLVIVIVRSHSPFRARDRPI
ncbi:hypothetical protein NL676_033892 [Syzygium grande]|nr:hypothetical protein NL676_033892 [Syzygium grande]